MAGVWRSAVGRRSSAAAAAAAQRVDGGEAAGGGGGLWLVGPCDFFFISVYQILVKKYFNKKKR